MLESGSLVTGTHPERWGLPPATALRYEVPAPALRPFLTDYHLFDSDPAVHDGVVNWVLPSWPAIRFTLAEEPFSLQLGPRTYDPLPRAALYGTTSRAMRMTTHGGVTVGIGISPLGWARLFKQPADQFRDRVVPLSTLMPERAVDALLERLAGCRLESEAKPILDDFFPAYLSTPSDKEDAIRALARLIASEETRDIESAAAEIGMTATQLRRLSTRYFGFPPKVLLVRARFMRSLLRILLAGPDPDYSLISPTYFDKSHFLRDARRFLNTTPRRFMQFDTRYMVANLRARGEVMHLLREQEGSAKSR